MQSMFIQLDRNRHRKMVFYGRVSTEHEAQLAALRNQMKWYEDQAQYHPNWTVMGRYIDEGITGTQAKKRPAFMKMLADAKQGAFDLIVTREVCRFARNTVDTLVAVRELKKYGVEVYFVEDNIWTMDGDGELRLTIMATLAQEESRKISERVLAGQAISRQKGVLYGTGNIIGYDRVGGTYVINEPQAEIIRLIYSMYLDGFGEKAIVNELTKRGCKNGRGEVKWDCPKVGRILKNATYKGYICYNKSVTVDFLEHRRIVNHDDSQHILVKGDFPAIISEEDWDRCAEIRKSKVKSMPQLGGGMRKFGRNPSKYLWSKKLLCSCGCSFQRFHWRTNKRDGKEVYGYQCYSHRNGASLQFMEENNLADENTCRIRSICDWKLELMAKTVLESVWTDRRPAVLEACDILNQCSKKTYQTERQDQVHLTKEIQKLKNRLQKLIEMRADGELSKEEFSAQKATITQQLQMAEAKQKEPISAPEQNVIDIDKIKDTLERVIDFTQPKLDEELLNQVISRVIPITNEHFRWELNLLPGSSYSMDCTITGRKNNPSISLQNGENSEILSTNSLQKEALAGGQPDRPPSRTPGKQQIPQEAGAPSGF